MKFKKYALKAFVDSYVIVWSHESTDVFQNGETYYVSFLVCEDIVAIYEWQDYEIVTEKQRVVEEKYEEVKDVFQSTIQVLFDRFPKTIREEVNILIKHYGASSSPTDLVEIGNQDNPIVQLYTNLAEDKWTIYLLNEFFCCVNNFNAANQIYMYLDRDCKNLIRYRWR